jgi:apolipoprotein D and lipocalin family protein
MRCRLAVLFVLSLSACAAHAPLPTVSHVDLDRYAGTWFEIARLPNRFERGCVAVTATYTARADGRIDVLNRCREERLDGTVDEAHAVARVVDDSSNAKLAVQFFWPFDGDYWIVALDAGYQWAVVGTPSRDYLWILSRTPHMKPSLYALLVERAASLGFDTKRLELTPQPPN